MNIKWICTWRFAVPMSYERIVSHIVCCECDSGWQTFFDCDIWINRRKNGQNISGTRKLWDCDTHLLCCYNRLIWRHVIKCSHGFGSINVCRIFVIPRPPPSSVSAAMPLTGASTASSSAQSEMAMKYPPSEFSLKYAKVRYNTVHIVWYGHEVCPQSSASTVPRYGTVWYSMVWKCMVSMVMKYPALKVQHQVCQDMVRYGIVWYRMHGME